MLNRCSAHGGPVTSKVLHLSHHARRRRKAKPHRTHRFGSAAACGAGHACHSHRNLGAGMGDGPVHHGAHHCFADRAVLGDKSGVYAQHVRFSLVGIGDKTALKPRAGARQVRTGRSNHAAGATFGGGQHLAIF